MRETGGSASVRLTSQLRVTRTGVVRLAVRPRAARPEAVQSERGRLAQRPLLAGAVALSGALGFVLARLWLAADGNVTRFVRAAWPFARRGGTPPGLFVFPGNGYDGQFYYRLALDPSNLHRSAYGITLDHPFRVQRIGYPVLAWLASLGQHAWVPVALVAVNVLALGAIGLIGGALARDCGRPAPCGLLFAGYFGFFMSLGCDLTEPVAAACLLGGILAWRRGRPWLAGLALAYGALTRETVIIAALALGLTRVVAAARGRGSAAGVADVAWCLPVVVFAGWQVVLRAATGRFIFLAGFGSNAGGGVPFGAFARALSLNLGLARTSTGAAYIWLLEVATLAAFVLVALFSWRRRPRGQPGLGYERVALVAFLGEAGLLSADIWTGHADLRSIDEVYLLAVLIVLGSGRRIRALALGAAAACVVAATHQALWF